MDIPNKILASEASAMAENQKPKNIELQLRLIYSQIQNAAKSGKYAVEVEITENIPHIITDLANSGYKTRRSFGPCYVISWKTTKSWLWSK